MATQGTKANAGSSSANSIAYPMVAQASGFLLANGTAFLGSVTLINLAGVAVATKKFVPAVRIILIVLHAISAKHNRNRNTGRCREEAIDFSPI